MIRDVSIPKSAKNGDDVTDSKNVFGVHIGENI